MVIITVPAVAEQRHRHPDDRSEAHHHRPVDQHAQGEGHGHARGRQSREVAVSERGGAKGDEDHRRIEQQHHDAADEAELLGQGGEDEVGALLRQEVELALGAQAEALAHQPAGAERDLGLDDVVAGAALVRLRVDESEQAGALVGLEHQLEHHRQAAAMSNMPAPTSRRLRPASTIIPAPVRVMRIAVPKSGWWATRAAGTRISPAGINRLQESRARSGGRPW